MANNSGIDSRYAVMIPCPQEDFAKFISGLLGRPQTLERHHQGSFDVSHKDIENTYHLVNQRVTQQNVASLIQFTVKILYSDNSSVLLNSFDDFQNYNEIKPLVSVAAHLTWTYLIHFPDRNVPEKQEIVVSFTSSSRHSFMFEDETTYTLWDLSGGAMSRITHTARTWGTDIDSLLQGHIKTLRRKQGPVRRWITTHSGSFGFIAGIFFLVSTYLAGYYAANDFLNAQLARLHQFVTSSEHVPTVAEKLDFLLQLISEGAWARFSFFVGMVAIFLLLFAVAFGIVVGVLADNKPASFVVLSKQAEVKRAQVLQKEERQWLGFLGSVGADFLAAVAAHGFFTHYLAKLLY